MKNRDFAEVGHLAKIESGFRAIWNPRGYSVIAEAIRRFCPDVIHAHNFFPSLSPAIYYAAWSARCPVVQTLHNFRLVCLNGLLFRGGRICERCVGTFPLAGVRFGCYRQTRTGSVAVATMLGVHRTLGTWKRRIARFIALSEFARMRFIAGGLPAQKVAVAPNFLADEVPEGQHMGGYFLYAGRLTREKGIGVALKAWEQMPASVPLWIAGDGPMREAVEEESARRANLKYLGRLNHEEVRSCMRNATALLVPSLWHENCPMVIIEALAAGLPIVASRVGGIGEMCQGLAFSFEPGNEDDLCDAVLQVVREPHLLRERRATGRALFQARFSARVGHERLVGIYEAAITETEGRKRI